MKLFFAVLVIGYFGYYAVSYTEWHFIDNLNLIIHEAGHTLFTPFGDKLHTLGGSLLQILMPFLFVIYFFNREQYYSSTIMLFWVSQNLLNVSIYAGDAVRMELPLLGGENTIHDWNHLLEGTGWLKYVTTIEHSFYYSGLVLLLIAAYYSISLSITTVKVTASNHVPNKIRNQSYD
ncbi:hypothetical protein HGA64_03420 [Candidatus Falkowbacteria bacterium]|nr:hypothetical protein [Candidatus Falkowbacteria bacterium]